MREPSYRRLWSRLIAATVISAPAQKGIRRAFTRYIGGLMLIVGTGASCGGDDPIVVDTGTVQVTINGFVTSIATAGTVQITGSNIDDIELILPGLATGEVTVPVGTYHVVYTPPAGYAMASGQSNELDVTVTKDEATEVTLTVVQASGLLRLTVAGLVGAPNGGSAQVLRTDIGGQVPQAVNVPATGTVDVTLVNGSYSVTYTPPAGHVLAAGETNPQTAVVGAGITSVTFDVIEATGTLRLTVTGLGDAAPNGGSAQVLRTDIAGQTPQGVNVPLSGTVDVNLLSGTYSITYSPPAGHDLVDGETNPETAVIGAGITNVSFAVEVATTAADVVFNSDWSTALGSSNAALLDTSKPLPWDMKGGNGSLNEIIPNNGALGFPAGMANVFRNIAQFSGNSGQTVLTDQLRLTHTNNHIPIPAAGGSLFYRWYMRYVVPDGIDPDGGTPHPVQDGPAASQQNWMWETPILQNGTWTPQFNFAGANDFPNNRWASAPLSKNVTYRIEFRLHRVSATQFTPEVRIFDGTTQVRGNSDFVNRNGSLTFANAPVLNITNLAFLAGFQMGNNGPSWNNLTAGQFPFDLWYLGGACIRTVDWCGPYSGGI